MQIACNQRTPAVVEAVTLKMLKNIPYELHEAMRFGRSIEAIDELNEFTLVTGGIDTSDEEKMPLKEIGLVSINGGHVFLDKISSKTADSITA